MNKEQAIIELEQCERKIKEYEEKTQKLLPPFLYDCEEVERTSNNLEMEIMKEDVLKDFMKGGRVDD